MGGLAILMLAIIEISLQLATAAALEWTALRASRFGITGAQTVRNVPQSAQMPTCRSAIIPWLITYATSGFLQQANLTVTVNVYSNLSSGQSGAGGTSGQGAGGAIVGYQISYRRPFITPIPALITGRTQIVHSASMLVKNEPFENATC